MAMNENIEDSEAARRDRGIGQDIGQGGAENTRTPSQPNKSKRGDKDLDESVRDTDRDGAQPTFNRGDRKNLGI